MNKYVKAFLNFKSYSSSTIKVNVERNKDAIASELIYEKDDFRLPLAGFSEALYYTFYTSRYYLTIYLALLNKERGIPAKILNNILKIMKNMIKGVEDFFGVSLGLEPVIDKDVLILKEHSGIEYIPSWNVCQRGFNPHLIIVGYPSIPYREDLAEAVKEFRELYLEYKRLIDDAHALGLDSKNDIRGLEFKFSQYELTYKISGSDVKVLEDRILFNCRDKPITIREIKTGVEILKEIVPELKKTLVKHEILSL